MTREPRPARSMRDPVVVGAFALLALVSVLGNRVAPGAYVLWSVLGAAGLVLLARSDGLGRADWGVGRVGRRQVVAAMVALVATCAVMLVASALPAFSAWFADDRVAGADAGRIAWLALVRVPFGTVLIEEVAFRGVLLAMLARRIGTAAGVAVSSMAFGAWHVLPALGVAAGNAALVDVFGSARLAAVLSGVLASAAAGTAFCWLRLRFDHLVVPMALHASANGMAYWLAWQAVSG